MKLEDTQPTLVLQVTKPDYGKPVTIRVNGEMTLNDVLDVVWKNSAAKGARARTATGLFSSDERLPGPWDDESWALLLPRRRGLRYLLLGVPMCIILLKS